MNKIYCILTIVLLASVIPACTEKEEVFGPVFEIYGGQQTLTFNNNGGVQSMMINTNRDFTVQSSEAWCSAEIIPEQFNNLSVSVSASAVIGKQRTATITVSSEGLDDIVIDVIQDGIAPVINSSQANVVLEDGESTFSLTITTNLLVDFILPDYIHLQDNNTPEIGEKTYHFDIDAIAEGEVRTENIIVKAADSEINKSISIPITQGKELEPIEIVVEAETSEEGYEAKIQSWWETSGNMWGGNEYIALRPNDGKGTATYQVNVEEAGAYNFTFDVACWGGGTLTLFIDDVEVGSVNVANTDGSNTTHATIENISLTSGNREIKISVVGNFDFDLFTLTAH